MKKILFDRIINPIIHSRDEPENVAFGVAIGLWVGLTPTVGVQMTIVLLLSFIPKLKFNLPVGLAMVWLSNPLTMIPLYYFFYLVGLLTLGRDGMGFESFKSIFQKFIDSIENSDSFINSFWEGLVGLFYVGVDLAIPMWVGAIILATLSSIPAYFVCLRYLKMRHLRAKSVDSTQASTD